MAKPPKGSDGGIDGPVVLKIPPKECVRCGGKYIPTGHNQIYCPSCRAYIRTGKAAPETKEKPPKEEVMEEKTAAAAIETPEQPAVKEAPEKVLQAETPETWYKIQIEKGGERQCTAVARSEFLQAILQAIK